MELDRETEERIEQPVSAEAERETRLTPAEAFGERPKASPKAPGRSFPSHYRIRRDRIDPSGVITLRYNSRLHHIGLGRRYAGIRVMVLVADLDVRVLTEDGELLRELTLDPSRDYQRRTTPSTCNDVA